MRTPRSKILVETTYANENIQSEIPNINHGIFTAYRTSYAVIPAFLIGLFTGSSFPFWSKNSYQYLLLFLQTYLNDFTTATDFRSLLANQLQSCFMLLFLLLFLRYSAFGIPVFHLVLFSKGFMDAALYTCIFSGLIDISLRVFFSRCVLYTFGCHFILLQYLLDSLPVSRSIFQFVFNAKKFPDSRSKHIEQLLGTCICLLVWCMISHWLNQSFFA